MKCTERIIKMTSLPNDNELLQSPFPGINPFSYANREVFFSREADARSLIRLVVMYRGTLLFAEQGTGKSSLINSGLIPLAKDEGLHPERIRINPKRGEEIIIERISERADGKPPYLPSIFTGDEMHERIVLSVEAFLETIEKTARGSRPLLIFDQFEEWVTLFEDSPPGSSAEELVSIKERIKNTIVSIMNNKTLPAKILLSFREDYLARLDPIFKECPNLPDIFLRLTPLKGPQIFEIIYGPFEKYPGKFISELSPSLAKDIQTQFEERMHGVDIRLAEVQIVCESLFDSGEKGPDLEKYFNDEGGVQGILEKYLERKLNSLDTALREPAIALLAHMITSAGTRKVISQGDLLTVVSLEDNIPDNLLSTALDSLERDTKLILRERRRDVYYCEIASEFIVNWIVAKSRERNIKTRDKKLREAQQRIKLEKRKAEQEARNASKLRMQQKALGIITTFTIIAFILSFYLWQDASHQKRLTAVQELIWAARNNLTVDPELSLLLSMHAASELQKAGEVPPPEVESTFRDSLRAARLRMTLSGHYNSIRHVTFNVSGDKLASAEENGKIKIWDSKSGDKLVDINGHAGNVHSVSFNDDGSLLASGGADRTVKLWDVNTGRELLRLDGHYDPVMSTAFSPDGQRIVSAGLDRTIKLWDSKTGAMIRTFSGHSAGVYCVAFNPDGTRIASGGDDKVMIIWDVETGEVLQGLNEHKDRISAVSFSPDGERIASSSYDGTVKVWSTESNSSLLTFSEHDSEVNSLAFSPDGKYLITGSRDNTVHIWDSATGTEYMPHKNIGSAVYTADFSPNGKQFVTGALDGRIQLWDFPTRLRTDSSTSLLTMLGDPARIWAAAYGPEGEVIATAGSEGNAKVWDARTGIELFTLSGHHGQIVSIAISNIPNNLRIATASTDGTVKVWDGATGKELITRKTHDPFRFIGLDWPAVAFSHNGKRFVTGSSGNKAIVWDAETGEDLFSLHGHTRAIFSIKYSPNGKYIAASSFDNNAYIWDATSGNLLRTIKDHRDGVSGISFSDDGKYLATCGVDGTVILRRAGSWDVIRTIAAHSNLVIGVAFSPDGKLLATSSADKTVKVWNIDDVIETFDFTSGKKPPQTLYGHKDAVITVAFSPDGNRLVTASLDGTSKVWEVDPKTSHYTVNAPNEKITSIAFSPKDNRLVTGSDDWTATIIDVETNKELLRLGTPKDFKAFAVLSPDGKHLASSHPNGTVRIFDVATGNIKHSFPAYKSQVTDIAFSPDGTQIVAVSNDKKRNAKVWDTKSHKLLFEMRGHSNGIKAVAYSPDGKSIATASSDHTARIWDASNGKSLHVLKGHTNEVFDVAFSHNGLLATGSRDMTAKVWDISSGELIKTLPKNSWWVNSVKFSHDGKRIVTASRSFFMKGFLKVWDTSTSKLLNEFKYTPPGGITIFSRDNPPYNSFDLSPDGDYLLTAEHTGTIKIWDVKRGKPVHELNGHTDRINSLAFSADGTLVASTSDDMTARLWSREKGNEIATLVNSPSPVYGASFGSDDERILIVTKKWKATVWDQSTDKKEAEIDILPGHAAPVKAAAFSVDERKVITVSPDNTARIWDAQTGEERSVIPIDGHIGSDVSALAISSDNDHIAIAGQGGAVGIWDVKKKESVEASARHKGKISSIGFSPDGKLVVSGSSDSTAMVWRASDGQQMPYILQGHSANVSDVTFSPDGKRIATVSDDKTAKVWDATTGKILFTLSAHTDENPSPTKPIMYMPDGRRLVTGGNGGAINIWDAERGDHVWTIQAYTDNPDEITKFAFDPSGKWLAVLSRNGQVQLYAFAMEECLKLARKRITRALTSDECKSFFRQNNGRCPEEIEAIRMLVQGRNEAKHSEYDDAVRSFERALSLDSTLQINPKDEAGELVAETLVAEGIELRRRKDLNGAADKFVQALRYNYAVDFGSPSDEEIGDREEQLDEALRIINSEPEESISLLMNTLAYDPGNVSSHYGLGLAYKEIKEFKKAIDHFNIALHFSKGDDRYLYADLAQAYSLDNRHDKAMEYVKKALEDDARFGYGLIASGRILRNGKQCRNAVSTFDKVRKDDPDYIIAVQESGSIYHDCLYEYDSAYSKFKEAFELYQDDPSFVANFAEANLVTRRYKEASTYARQVLDRKDTEQLSKGSQLAMRYIILAAALLDKQRDVAHQELKNFIEEYNTVEKGYKSGWEYSGTREFFSKQTMDKKKKELLIGFIDILEKEKDKDLKLEEFEDLL